MDNLILKGKYQSWKEITPLINAELWEDESNFRDESAYRKAVCYARKFYEAGVFDKYTDDKYSKELQVQKRELEKERQKMAATKIEYTRQIRQQSRFELFYENIRDRLQVYEPPEFKFIPKDKSQKEYLLGLADIHAGANFNIGTNCYSLAECERRFNVLYNEVVDYVINNNISTLNIVELGDTIQGMLRLTDLQLNESTVVESVVFIARLISKFLNDLSAECNIEYYHVPTANHTQTRPIGTKASELASEDVEYIIGSYIKDTLAKNKRVNVYTNFGEDYIEIPIFNFNVISLHGHTIKNIGTSLRDLSLQNRKFYDYVIMGHYHGGKEETSDEGENNDTEVIICPSFIGTDPYSKSIRKSSKGACKIWRFDEKYGYDGMRKIILN